MAGPFHPSRPATLQLTLPPDLGEVRPAAQAVRRFLAAEGCEEQELTDCELALVEACNNALLHAGAGAPPQPVVVEAHCDAGDIELRVTDHTPGFEWPEQAGLPDTESENGRGLFLIRALMDDAKYCRSARGNTLVLRKRRRRQGKGVME